MQIQVPFRHYRICNADFAVLTANEEICRKANEAADRMAALGVHLGTVRIEPGCPPAPQLRSLATLLHPLQVCVIVDPERPAWLARLTREALEIACRDGTSPWRGRLPRVLSFQPASILSTGDLVSLAQGLANHTLSDGDAQLPLAQPDRKRSQPGSKGPRLAAAAAVA